MTHGSRFSGGYQFPRTNSASLARGTPLLEERNVGPARARVQLVPLVGARTGVWDLCALWGHETPGADVGSYTILIDREEAGARVAFGELVALFRDGKAPAILDTLD